jgi:adenylosuccinate lyase
VSDRCEGGCGRPKPVGGNWCQSCADYTIEKLLGQVEKLTAERNRLLGNLRFAARTICDQNMTTRLDCRQILRSTIKDVENAMRANKRSS